MRFRSKKNKVTLRHGIIFKEYPDESALFREALALEYLGAAGLAVPALFGREDNALKMEYIPGVPYADLVEELSFEQAEALAAWLAEYHGLTSLLRGDCNLRNFLWSEGRCVGVDFEDEPMMGDGEIDMGKILAYAVTYSPPLTEAKAASAHLLLRAFVNLNGPLDLDLIKSAYLTEIAAMNSRRKQDAVHPHSAALFFDKFSQEKIQN